jgi:hypothetical protein
MRWVRVVVRVFGWLLTPLLAWAACFLGAVGGALLAMQFRDPRVGLAVTVLIGAAAGVAVIVLWLRLLRRSPQIRGALAVQSDGTPEIVALDADADASADAPDSDTASRPEAPHSAR